jgi:hypothetical protein
MQYPCDNLKSMLYVGGENVILEFLIFILFIKGENVKFMCQRWNIFNAKLIILLNPSKENKIT